MSELNENVKDALIEKTNLSPPDGESKLVIFSGNPVRSEPTIINYY